MKFLKGVFWAVFDFFQHPLMTEGCQERQEKRWVEEATRQSATHVIILWDSFEMEMIPRYVKPGEELDDVCARIRASGAHSVGEIITIKL